MSRFKLPNLGRVKRPNKQTRIQGQRRGNDSHTSRGKGVGLSAAASLINGCKKAAAWQIPRATWPKENHSVLSPGPQARMLTHEVLTYIYIGANARLRMLCCTHRRALRILQMYHQSHWKAQAGVGGVGGHEARATPRQHGATPWGIPDNTGRSDNHNYRPRQAGERRLQRPSTDAQLSRSIQYRGPGPRTHPAPEPARLTTRALSSFTRPSSQA